MTKCGKVWKATGQQGAPLFFTNWQTQFRQSRLVKDQCGSVSVGVRQWGETASLPITNNKMEVFVKWTHCGLRPSSTTAQWAHSGWPCWRHGWGNSMFEMCSHSPYFYFFFCLSGSFLLALVFCPPPLHSLCLSRSLFLSLCFSEWREHQRDQAGLAYWKQMADQRQEGHSFMKRGLNMPGPCRGACPWMMATWCVQVCVCLWGRIWGEMVNFVGYQSEEWDPKSQSVPAFSFFFSHHLCIPECWLRRCINDCSVIWWLWSPLLPVPCHTIIRNQRLAPEIHHPWAKWSRVQ